MAGMTGSRDFERFGWFKQRSWCRELKRPLSRLIYNILVEIDYRRVGRVACWLERTLRPIIPWLEGW